MSLSRGQKKKHFLCGFLKEFKSLALPRLYIYQLISVSRVVALTGSGSIKVVQSVHLFVRDEAQRMAGTVTWHTVSCDIIQYHYYGTCVCL